MREVIRQALRRSAACRLAGDCVREWRLRQFDRRNRVDTRGIIPIRALGVSGASSEQLYEGIDPRLFRSIFRRLPLHHSDYVFFDIGSGKGRALCLAAEWPFRSIVGIEISPALHQAAQRNIQSYSNPAQRCRQLESVCQDARCYRYPQTPSVFFFYNPFPGAENVLEDLLSRIHSSVEQKPRDVVLVYVFPHAPPAALGVLERGGVFEQATRHEWWSVYRSTVPREETERVPCLLESITIGSLMIEAALHAAVG